MEFIDLEIVHSILLSLLKLSLKSLKDFNVNEQPSVQQLFYHIPYLFLIFRKN